MSSRFSKVTRPWLLEVRSQKSLGDRFGRVSADDQASMNVGFYREQTFIR